MVLPDWRLVCLLQLLFTAALWPFLIKTSSLYSLLLVLLWATPYQQAPRLHAFSRKPLGKFLIVLAGLSMLAVSAGSAGLIRTLMSYLLLAAALKLFEFKQQRDLGALLVIYLFLCAMILILEQGWGMALLCLLILGFSGMLINQNFVALKLQQHARLVFRIGVAALPLTLLLFVVFPRLGPLWKMPEADLGRVGLSESMSPGDFSQLGRSAELAFRVNFQGAKPTQPELYWRTLVFEQFDGREWGIHPVTRQQHRQLSQLSSLREPSSAVRFRYQVIAEPSGQAWLFGLNAPWSGQTGVLSLPNQRLARDRVVNQTFQYQAQSHLKPLDSTLSAQLTRRNLMLPAGGGEQSREFANNLMQQAGSAERWAESLLNHFSTQAFYYTLQPGRYHRDPIDEFMFERRRGFCGHYASAMAFMARSVGIPARVVAGYQGGEWDPQGQYLSVYQFDAHAWVELYLPEKGWTRYDPTAAVAPQRVLSNVADALADEEGFLADSPLSLLRFKQSAVLSQLRWAIANMDYYWTLWVLGFDAQQQTRFWQQLFGDMAWLGKLVLLILAVTSPLLVLLFWKREQLSLSEVWQQYHRLIPKLEKAGWPQAQGTTPKRYAMQIKHSAPSVGRPFLSMVELCYQLEYAAAKQDRQEGSELKKIKKQAQLTKQALRQLPK